MRGSGLFAGSAPQVLTAVGIGEIVIGLLHLILWRQRGVFIADMVLLVVLAGRAAIGEPFVFVEPFNPVTLTVR